MVTFPETLVGDVYRIKKFKRDWRYIMRSMALMARLNNVMPREKYAGQLDTLASVLLGTTMRSGGIKKAVKSVLLESREVLNIGDGGGECVKETIQNAVLEVYDYDDAVLQLMNARFRNILIEIIKAGGGHLPPHIRLSAMNSNISSRILPLITDFASKVKPVIDLSESVHVSLYRKIILDASPPLPPMSGGGGR
jgi:hypothetical protein